MLSYIDTDNSIHVITSALVSLCFASTIIFGIYSWLRKRVSIEWWRDRCCGDTESGYSSTIGMPSIPRPKTPPIIQAPPGFTSEFDDISGKREKRGQINRAYDRRSDIYRSDRKLRNAENTDNVHRLKEPETNHNQPPPDYYCLEHTRLPGWKHIPQDPSMMDSFRSRTRSNTSDYRRTAKVISKPSITSDYVSDIEVSSDFQPHQQTVSRRPTGGRYSSRKKTEKKRRRRKHQTKMGSRTVQKTKYATTSIPSATLSNLRKPIARRHSCTATLRDKATKQTLNSVPVPPPRTKKKRSASDAHLFLSKKPVNIAHANAKRQSSFSHDTKSNNHKSIQSHNIDGLKTTSKPKIPQHNPHPVKSSGLVRSETIMEVPIYVKPERPRTYQPTSSQDTVSTAHEKHVSRKSRPKPPRAHARRDGQKLHHHRRDDTHGRRERWQFGYGSLPADFSSRLHSDLFAEIGMTPESFVESIEKLDFEKLCRPVPKITEDQRQTSPRKPVADKDTHGPDEQEILKNTYKLEEFGIVATDL